MSTWKIDPAHTDVLFSAKHLMVTTVRGKFENVDGELQLDENDPVAASGEIRVDVASVSSGNEQRDAHLRSGDFFDADAYPQIVARLRSIEPAGDAYRVDTDVTIRGVTRPVTFDGEFLGIVPGMDGRRHAGFSLSATIDREAWGLTWNMSLEAGGWLVGKDVKLQIDVAADEIATPSGVAEPELVGAAS